MLENLQAEMLRQNIRLDMIASLLEVDVRTVKNKISGKSDFRYCETIMVRDTYFPKLKLEYLFYNNWDQIV